MDLVSIVTPAYNAARFLRETVASVQQQTCRDWEMIIVDDCSRDDTAVVIEELARKESRLRFVRQRVNSGPAAARNAALSAASGRFIAFLDSDDLWLPEKLQRQLGFMREVDAAFSFTRYRRISDDGSFCGSVVEVPPRLDYAALLKNTAIATSTVIVDRQRTGPFAMTQTYYDDYVLWLELAKRGHVAHGLQQDLMRYRVVGKSVSRNKLRSARWVWHTYRNVQGLNWAKAVWCFMNYTFNALKKYRRF